jgi:hypothetical protein
VGVGLRSKFGYCEGLNVGELLMIGWLWRRVSKRDLEANGGIR